MRKQEIIQAIINKIRAKTYLEIGVQRGKNFFVIDAARKVAVDPNFMFGLIRRLKNLRQLFKHSFIEKTSDDFFSQDAKKLLVSGLDVAFIDGLHTYEQSLHDFENCLKFLNKGGVILFHDCNPLTEGAGIHANSPDDAREKFSDKILEWNGDVWKTIAHIRSHYDDLDVFVLDCDFGIGVVYRATPEKKLKWTMPEIKKLGFDYFNANRKELLNLKDPEYLHIFLEKLKPLS